MDTNTFKQTIHALSQQIGAQVLHIHPPEITPNFIAAALKFKQQTVYVLCSENQDWAFCQQLQPFKLQFIDMPDLAEILHNLTNIQVYNTTKLNTPFVAQSWMSKHDINYWQPQTLGDALFNWWD